MKNIHILPTDKPSRLGYLSKKGKEVYKDLRLFDKLMPNILDSENQHLYITSNEEIKEGDYVFNLTSRYVYSITELWEIVSYERKIILTTDQDLIADGVQAIDDDFLQWFVKNPSCEEVQITTYGDYLSLHYSDLFYNVYKIITPVVPREESKQETTIEEDAKDYMSYMKDVKSFLTKSEPGRSYAITDVEFNYAQSDDATGNGEGVGTFVFRPSPVDIEFDYSIKFTNREDEEADIDIEINFAPESNGYRVTSSKHSLKKQHVPNFTAKLKQIFKEEIAKFIDKQ